MLSILFNQDHASESFSTSIPSVLEVIQSKPSTTTSLIDRISFVVSNKDKEKESETSLESNNPWDLLKVSGCNIYGTFYKVEQKIDELSSSCKACVCSAFGVKCNKMC